MDRYESFLFLIGSVFVPLFGVLTADHFVNRRGHVETDELYSSAGRYWYAGGIRWGAVVPWLAGFVVYHWIVPTGPAWWTGWVTELVGDPLGVRWEWLAASIPSFVVAFVLALRRPDALRGRTRRSRPRSM